MAQEAITRKLTALLTGYLIKNKKFKKCLLRFFQISSSIFTKLMVLKAIKKK